MCLIFILYLPCKIEWIFCGVPCFYAEMCTLCLQAVTISFIPLYASLRIRTQKILVGLTINAISVVAKSLAVPMGISYGKTFITAVKKEPN